MLGLIVTSGPMRMPATAIHNGKSSLRSSKIEKAATMRKSPCPKLTRLVVRCVM